MDINAEEKSKKGETLLERGDVEFEKEEKTKSRIVLSKLCLLPKTSNKIDIETIEERKKRLEQKKWQKYLLNSLAIVLIGVLLILFICFR